MTLNEAIEHLDETLGDSSRTWSCEECKQEHIQLREWLIELKTMREAKTPRILTLKEVKSKPDYAWIEKLDSKKTYIVLFDFTTVLSDLSTYAHTWNHYGKDELLLLLLYNKTWRCWTSRPDDKRRAETPWTQTNGL